MPPNPGYGDCFEEPRTMFYFDSMDLKCKKFKVINCNIKNQNQFETYELCTRFCQSTACLAGQSLLLARDSSPVNCRQAGCPIGYRCVYDKLFNRHVCCGHSPTGLSLPPRFVPQLKIQVFVQSELSHFPTSDLTNRCDALLPLTEMPVQLTMSAQLRGYTASAVLLTMVHNLCREVIQHWFSAICPAGQQPYMHVVSKNSMKCNPLETSSCPETYYCSPAVPGAHWGFCCSVHIEASCPAETEAYLEATSKTPVRCTVGVTQCKYVFLSNSQKWTEWLSVGYSCQSSQSGSLIGFCCTIPKISYKPPARGSTSSPEYTTTLSDMYFVHNEGLIGPSVRTGRSHLCFALLVFQAIFNRTGLGHQKPAKKYQKVTKSTSTYGVVSNYKPATCPPKATSVFYANTQINVECTPAEGYSFECPGGNGNAKKMGSWNFQTGPHVLELIWTWQEGWSVVECQRQHRHRHLFTMWRLHQKWLGTKPQVWVVCLEVSHLTRALSR